MINAGSLSSLVFCNFYLLLCGLLGHCFLVVTLQPTLLHILTDQHHRKFGHVPLLLSSRVSIASIVRKHKEVKELIMLQQAPVLLF